MPESSNPRAWLVSPPSVWPKPPLWMSFTTLLDLEACPRRWALGAADYPHLWTRRGYPRVPQPAALEGAVVHLAIETVTSALLERRSTSLLDESAFSTLRELGGYTAVILRSLERVLLPHEANPRAAPVFDSIRRRLTARVPELRSRVQRFLSRIQLEGNTRGFPSSNARSAEESRQQLRLGSYSEVELRVSELRWLGVADLLTLSTTHCEIRDFKTGSAKNEHELQLLTYALLWARDRNPNPSGRLADRLVLSYEDGDVDVPAPGEHALRSIEDELRDRTTATLAALQADPPEARPSPDNCRYCPVRHMCEPYWRWYPRQRGDNESSRGHLADLQIKVLRSHGPKSWDSMVESSSESQPGAAILFRTGTLGFELHSGQRLRLLNVHMETPDEDPVEKRRAPAVATMLAGTEAFAMPE